MHTELREKNSVFLFVKQSHIEAITKLSRQDGQWRGLWGEEPDWFFPEDQDRRCQSGELHPCQEERLTGKLLNSAADWLTIQDGLGLANSKLAGAKNT